MFELLEQVGHQLWVIFRMCECSEYNQEAAEELQPCWATKR